MAYQPTLPLEVHVSIDLEPIEPPEFNFTISFDEEFERRQFPSPNGEALGEGDITGDTILDHLGFQLEQDGRIPGRVSFEEWVSIQEEYASGDLDPTEVNAFLAHGGTFVEPSEEQTVNEVLRGIAERYYCITPIHAYIHSDVSLSTSSFKDRFDSGLVGIAFEDRASVLKRTDLDGLAEVPTHQAKSSLDRKFREEAGTSITLLTGPAYNLAVFDANEEQVGAVGGVLFTEEELDDLTHAGAIHNVTFDALRKALERTGDETIGVEDIQDYVSILDEDGGVAHEARKADEFEPATPEP